MVKIKQGIQEIENQNDFQSEMISIIYQISACDSKSFAEIIYNKVARMKHADIYCP